MELVVDEGISGATLARPALVDALARLDAEQAEVLLASKLDRARQVGVVDVVSAGRAGGAGDSGSAQWLNR